MQIPITTNDYNASFTYIAKLVKKYSKEQIGLNKVREHLAQALGYRDIYHLESNIVNYTNSNSTLEELLNVENLLNLEAFNDLSGMSAYFGSIIFPHARCIHLNKLTYFKNQHFQKVRIIDRGQSFKDMCNEITDNMK